MNKPVDDLSVQPQAKEMLGMFCRVSLSMPVSALLRCNQSLSLFTRAHSSAARSLGLGLAFSRIPVPVVVMLTLPTLLCLTSREDLQQFSRSVERAERQMR